MTNKEMKEAIRRLQKDGSYSFEGLSRDESRKASEKLVRLAKADDRKNGIESDFTVVRDVFGYYYAVQVIC